jgi:tetratricopeptide (TPR) repeat protein
LDKRQTKALPVESAKSAASLPLCIGLGLVVVVLFLTYANSLENDFHYDDYHSIVKNRHIRSLGNMPQFFTDPQTFSMLKQRAMFRPLVLTSYALNHQFGQYRAYGYRLLNLAVHAACALLVFALARGLGLKPMWSGFASLVFSLHPVQAETVNYISSRSESLAALGFLLGLIAFVRFRDLAARKGGGVTWFYVLAVGSLVVGLLAKSIVATLPAAILFFDWSGQRGRGDGHDQGRDHMVSEEMAARVDIVSWLRIHLPLWIVVALYFVIVREFAATALATPVRSLDIQLFTQVKALVYYAMLTIMPVKLSIDHQFLASPSLASAPVVGAAALMVSMAVILLRTRARMMQALLLPMAWSVLVLLPTIIVPLNVLVNEHRLYLPLAFGAIALAGLIPGRESVVRVGRARAIQITLGLCLLCFGFMSHERNQVWKNNFTIWSDAVSKGPLMFRAHQELGGVYESTGDLKTALRHYETASMLAPEVPEVHYNRGNALRVQGRTVEAEQAYRVSLDASGETFVPALINLSSLLRQVRPDESMALMEKARTLEPTNPDVWRALALLYKDRGQTAAAQSAFKRSLDLEPASAVTHYSLGNLYFNDKKLEAAILQYQAAIAIDEAMHDARYNLALLYLRLGQFQEVQALSAHGLRRWPERVKLHYALAKAQEGLGMRSAAAGNYRKFLPHAASAALRESINKRIKTLETTQ